MKRMFFLFLISGAIALVAAPLAVAQISPTIFSPDVGPAVSPQSTAPGADSTSAALLQSRREAVERLLIDQELSAAKRFDREWRAETIARIATSPALFEQVMATRKISPDFTLFGAELVYTPVAPCRIFDTRFYPTGSNPLAAGETRSFGVAGFGSYAFQGGDAGNCGAIPAGSTRAVVLNFVAVAPLGGGNLQAWPSDLSAPTASVLNYQKLTPNLNSANAIIVPICSTCTYELSVRANISSTGVLADIVGYFAPASCGSGKIKYAGKCYETSLRTAALWRNAVLTCGAVGATLATPAELIAADAVLQLEPLVKSEWTADLLFTGPNDYAIAVSEGGAISSGLLYSEALRYRCVSLPLD